MNEKLRILLQIESLNVGIVPVVDAIYLNVNELLKSTDPKEARKMKRKFRKLWRKISTTKKINLFAGKDKTPTIRTKNLRKQVVADKLRQMVREKLK